VIRFVIAGIPPSSNNAYFNLPKGGRKLTAAGEKFKTETEAYVTRNLQPQIRGVKKDHPYGLGILLKMSIFDKRPGRGQRYKKTDATNRIKLLEDAVATAIGIDDSQFVTCIINKIDATAESTEVVIWDLVEESLADVVRAVGFQF
jgi:Holliday junction resolvase RusA-like endonuclease